jgi:hypothetical protein
MLRLRGLLVATLAAVVACNAQTADSSSSAAAPGASPAASTATTQPVGVTTAEVAFPSGPPFAVADLRVLDTKSGAELASVAVDGTVMLQGKAIAKVSGNKWLQLDGKAVFAVGQDGSVTHREPEISSRFGADDAYEMLRPADRAAKFVLQGEQVVRIANGRSEVLDLKVVGGGTQTRRLAALLVAIAYANQNAVPTSTSRPNATIKLPNPVTRKTARAD